MDAHLTPSTQSQYDNLHDLHMKVLKLTRENAELRAENERLLLELNRV